MNFAYVYIWNFWKLPKIFEYRFDLVYTYIWSFRSYLLTLHMYTFKFFRSYLQTLQIYMILNIYINYIFLEATYELCIYIHLQLPVGSVQHPVCSMEPLLGNIHHACAIFKWSYVADKSLGLLYKQCWGCSVKLPTNFADILDSFSLEELLQDLV